MKEDIKRVFFGLEVDAPWPTELPRGRILDAGHRHMTLAFLGNVQYPPLRDILINFPTPPIKIGLVGHFDKCLALPPRRPHAVAWHALWQDDNQKLVTFQKTLSDWLRHNNYTVDEREWLPHTTLCRQPFDLPAWEKAFVSIPFYTGAIHLYESLGDLKYVPIWSYPILGPFEEIEHIADMGFKIYGETIQQLYHHAFTAIAFKFPQLLDYFKPVQQVQTLDEIIMTLNEIVGRADGEIGCPMKAVSYHGDIVKHTNSTLEWEMIVDV